jgi:hypothetical protein
MKIPHIITTVLIIFVIYLVGVKFPSFGQTVLSKVGL